MTQEELEKGFERQVYLYSGLGAVKMKEIIEKQFPNRKADICPKCNAPMKPLYDKMACFNCMTHTP